MLTTLGLAEGLPVRAAAERAPRVFRLPGLAACVLALALAPPGRAMAGVTVQLSPATLSVAPNTEFDVKLRVTQAGSAFNAFHAIVTYDPTMLTPVPLSPLRYQLDSLVTTACSSTFHRFRHGLGRDTVDVSLLCQGVTMSGPGALYRLRFRSGATPGRTGLAFGPGLEFADGGVTVPAIAAAGTVVGVGVPVLDAEPGGSDPGHALSVSPNPARGAVEVGFGAALAAGATLEVFDPLGRRLLARDLAPGALRWRWDGRDQRGRALAPGRYVVVLRTADGIRRAPFVRLP